MKRWKMKRAVCLLLAAVLLFSLGGYTAANRPASTGGSGRTRHPIRSPPAEPTSPPSRTLRRFKRSP